MTSASGASADESSRLGSLGPGYEWDKHLMADSPAVRAFARRWGANTAAGAAVTAADHLRRHANVVAPPIALTPIVAALGARHQQVQMKGLGSTSPTPQGWLVRTPAGVPWRRARFSLAHEIGHLLLFQAVANRDDLFDDLYKADLWRDIELLCDYAGSHLLLPRTDLRACLEAARSRTDPDAAERSGSTSTNRGLLPSESTVRALYDRYLVSTDVLARALLVECEATMLVYWEVMAHGSSAPDWRVAGFTRNRELQHGDEQAAMGIPGPNIYIKRTLSRTRVTPDLISEAAATGYARADIATFDVGGRRYTGDMVALTPRQRTFDDQPLFEGRTVPDEQPTTVFLLMSLRSSGPTSQKTKFA